MNKVMITFIVFLSLSLAYSATTYNYYCNECSEMKNYNDCVGFTPYNSGKCRWDG